MKKLFGKMGNVGGRFLGTVVSTRDSQTSQLALNIMDRIRSA